MKHCFKCGESKPLADFYRHPMMADGHLGKCKECTKKDTKSHYITFPEKHAAYERKRCQQAERKALKLVYEKRHIARNPEKAKARNAVHNAIRDGRFERKPCEVCGSVKSQAHHEDYSKPFDVRWLCFKHHREAHGQRVIAS